MAARAETIKLTDGATFSGDILKFDDNNLMLRTGDTYTNLMWGRFSQETLKQLSANPKLAPYVDVFIEPDQSQRPAKPEIKLNPVKRLERPAEPSLLVGLVKSSLGWFILLLIYAANLYAAFEVSVIRARPAAQVMGLAALLPVIGPIIFLWLPVKIEASIEETGPGAPVTMSSGQPGAAASDIQIVDASWKHEEKKVEPQVFARGKFTFNKRFLETKFAGYLGVPAGDALKFTMELATPKGRFTVERIAQVAAAEAIFETTQSGQLTVPFTDIQEIKLIPKPV
jgi:hypothetical protein